MAVEHDPRPVVKRDEEHLRRFLAARDRGDAVAMRRWWDELVVDFFDRMDGLVAAAHRGRLDAEEHELAVSLALTRFSARLIDTFEGVSIGQLVNACRTMAEFVCMDVQRRAMREHRTEGPSLDARPGEGAATPAWEVAESLRRRDDDERRAEVREFLDWALPQVKEERRRVLELTFHGAALEEIAERLSISAANAYQRRSRGMKDLKRLKERFDA